MRHVLRSTAEVCHFWANQSQESGTNKTRSVYFTRDRIYSYGAHFCIARMLPSGVVAFTTRDYSVTTTAHKSHVRSAVRDRTVVYCDNPAGLPAANMDSARTEIRDLLRRAQQPRIRQTTRVRLRADALHAAQRANEYLAALPESERGSIAPIETADLEGAQFALEQLQAAEQRLRDERRAARMSDLAEDLAKWRAHDIIARTGLSELPCALRLSLDKSRIQTSWGAEIDAKHAPRLWRLIEGVRTRCAGDAQTTAALGPYSLRLVRADGSIVVGCHDIPYSELEGIAQQLGYAKAA